jgi:hypothetical protein
MDEALMGDGASMGDEALSTVGDNSDMAMEESLVEVKKPALENKHRWEVIGLAGVFFLQFFAYSTTQVGIRQHVCFKYPDEACLVPQNLETTLNDHLGFWSLAILYLFMSFSNLFTSHIVRRLGVTLVATYSLWYLILTGPRASLVIGSGTYTLYIAANIHPNPFLLLPCSALIGMGAALLWNAQGVGYCEHLSALSDCVLPGRYGALL